MFDYDKTEASDKSSGNPRSGAGLSDALLEFMDGWVRALNPQFKAALLETIDRLDAQEREQLEKKRYLDFICERQAKLEAQDKPEQLRCLDCEHRKDISYLFWSKGRGVRFEKSSGYCTHKAVAAPSRYPNSEPQDCGEEITLRRCDFIRAPGAVCGPDGCLWEKKRDK